MTQNKHDDYTNLMVATLRHIEKDDLLKLAALCLPQEILLKVKGTILEGSDLERAEADIFNKLARLLLLSSILYSPMEDLYLVPGGYGEGVAERSDGELIGEEEAEGKIGLSDVLEVLYRRDSDTREVKALPLNATQWKTVKEEALKGRRYWLEVLGEADKKGRE